MTVRDTTNTPKTRPDYCASEGNPDNLNHTQLEHFVGAHPNLGLSVSDIELLVESVAEIGKVAAEEIFDHDAKGIVRTKGKYHQKAVTTLAEQAMQGDAEAALIYGSYLMTLGYRHGEVKRVLLDLNKIREGEELLQFAFRNGFPEAADRIYTHLLFASVGAWRRSGESAAWHEVHTSYLAYNHWRQQHASLGRALVAQNDYQSLIAESPNGLPIPNGNTYPPQRVAEKLLSLEQRLPMPPESAALATKREHLLWLDRHGAFESMAVRLAEDCQTVEPSETDT